MRAARTAPAPRRQTTCPRAPARGPWSLRKTQRRRLSARPWRRIRRSRSLPVAGDQHQRVAEPGRTRSRPERLVERADRSLHGRRQAPPRVGDGMQFGIQARRRVPRQAAGGETAARRPACRGRGSRARCGWRRPAPPRPDATARARSRPARHPAPAATPPRRSTAPAAPCRRCDAAPAGRARRRTSSARSPSRPA